MATVTALGAKIFELRKKLRLTQVQLGERVGVSGAAISQFEKGINKPTYATLSSLGEVLNYYFHDLAKIEETPDSLQASDALELVTAFARRYNHEDKTIDSELRPNGQVETRIELILFSQREFIDFLNAELEGVKSYIHNNYFLTNITALPSIDYQSSIVLEIQGNSMEPRYPDQSRYVISRVDAEHWQYAIGVHAIWLKNEKFFFKRIKSNKDGVLVLHSDAMGEQTVVSLNDVSSLWKAGQAIHMPPEEL